MRERVRLIWGDRKAEYFSRDDWTGGIGLKGLMKLALWRRRLLRVEGAQWRTEGRSIEQSAL
jgi:hypothetical protein